MCSWVYICSTSDISSLQPLCLCSVVEYASAAMHSHVNLVYIYCICLARLTWNLQESNQSEAHHFCSCTLYTVVVPGVVACQGRLSWRGGGRGRGGGGMMRKKHKHEVECGDLPPSMQMRSRAMSAPLSTRTESGVNTQYTEARHYVRQIHVWYNGNWSLSKHKDGYKDSPTIWGQYMTILKEETIKSIWNCWICM